MQQPPSRGVLGGLLSRWGHGAGPVVAVVRPGVTYAFRSTPVGKQSQSPSHSNPCRKPSKGQSVFEAAGEGDALDALEAGAGRQVVARQGSGSRWGLLSRKGSSSAAREAQLLQQEHDQELAALRADCAAQAAEAAAMRAQLGEAHEELNLQRFKYELLVDLVSLYRVNVTGGVFHLSRKKAGLQRVWRQLAAALMGRGGHPSTCILSLFLRPVPHAVAADC